MMRPVTIRRRYKHEAEQAIRDLEKRGFEVVFPLTKLYSDRKYLGKDRNGRGKFYGRSFSTYWVAKLKRGNV